MRTRGRIYKKQQLEGLRTNFCSRICCCKYVEVSCINHCEYSYINNHTSPGDALVEFRRPQDADYMLEQWGRRWMLFSKTEVRKLKYPHQQSACITIDNQTM